MLDTGLVLFTGLVILFVLRQCCAWQFWGVWMKYTNYIAQLYVLLVCIMLYVGYVFIWETYNGSSTQRLHELPGWLHIMVICAPWATVATLFSGAYQSLGHIAFIRRDRAALKHDRAVMIIALPAVYSVMAMGALARVFQYFVNHSDGARGNLEFTLRAAETCFWVGDLYEAWALYQFGKLTLELIGDSIARQQKSDSEEDKKNAGALMVSHTAVENLAWLGILLFLIVCFLQSGWSLYLLTFAQNRSDSMNQFTAAGMVASAAAIWNVHVVESTFHEYLGSYNPLLKFITVKILVSFAFFQRGFFNCLEIFNETLPGMVRSITRSVPVLGDILEMPDVEFEMFYASLLSMECLVVGLMHLWAWNASEEWYLREEAGNPFSEGDLEESKLKA